ncbi:putative GLABROUS1 enhancer-binding protein family [Helianthus annuus]|nr:putative GLABROUS1 enhancer-binding protein family [Helianthus annuus]
MADGGGFDDEEPQKPFQPLQQQYEQGMGAGAGAGASNSNAAVSNLVEETVKSCLLPLFKELFRICVEMQLIWGFYQV